MTIDSSPVKKPSTAPPWVTAIVLTLAGIGAFWCAANPNKFWDAQWWNFIGAFLVALGGLLAALHAYGVVERETRPASWTCVLLGGAVIAGASLQFALAPR